MAMDELVVYGDFACPLSRMASQFVDALVARGTPVAWNAVRADGRGSRGSRIVGVACVRPGSHDPRHPSSSVRAELDGASTTETFDPSLAIAALAQADGCEAHRLRAALFHAHWHDHRDLGDRRVVEELAHRPVAPHGARASRWQREGEGVGDPAVPLVLLRTGYVFREADAIDELVRRLDTTALDTTALDGAALDTTALDTASRSTTGA
jgi:hypothetical protein